MVEYINRQDAITQVIHDCGFCRKYSLDRDGVRCEYCTVGRVHQILRDMPSADVVTVRHGEWFVSIGKDGKPVGTICPICGFAWFEAIDAVKLEPSLSMIKTQYCPNCGCRMDLEVANER